MKKTQFLGLFLSVFLLFDRSPQPFKLPLCLSQRFGVMPILNSQIAYAGIANTKPASEKDARIREENFISLNQVRGHTDRVTYPQLGAAIGAGLAAGTATGVALMPIMPGAAVVGFLTTASGATSAIYAQNYQENLNQRIAIHQQLRAGTLDEGHALPMSISDVLQLKFVLFKEKHNVSAPIAKLIWLPLNVHPLEICIHPAWGTVRDFMPRTAGGFAPMENRGSQHLAKKHSKNSGKSSSAAFVKSPFCFATNLCFKTYFAFKLPAACAFSCLCAFKLPFKLPAARSLCVYHKGLCLSQRF
jgi:hypothetical protein